jgi:hypothetical protein
MSQTSQSPVVTRARQAIPSSSECPANTTTVSKAQDIAGSTTHLDDPDHDICARQVHLARHLAVRVHGTELNDLIDSVDEALADLAALPDEAAISGELVGVTCALMGVELFLRKLADAFDAAKAEEVQR